MLLREAMLKQGAWLFRWRSYLPLVLFPMAILAARASINPERWGGENYWDLLCLGIAFLGLALRVATVGAVPRGTSGRNTSEQRADHLNTTGVYSIVRNPLYLGNFLMILGIVLISAVWWFVLLVCAAFFLYYERIIYTEESFLESRFGERYVEWAARTPLFIPNPFLWKRSEVAFSARKAIRQEYSGLYVIVAFSTITDMLCDMIGSGESLRYWASEDAAWLVFFGVGTAAYLALRFLKKHTSMLDLPRPGAGCA